MSNDNARASVSRAKRWFDRIVTMAMFAGAIAVVGVTVSRRQARSVPLSSLEAPADPVSIVNAAAIGSSEAKAVLIEFSDFECPFCAVFAENTLPNLKKRFVDTGVLQVVFLHLPLTGTHPRALAAAVAAECAKAQGRFEQMHDSLFRFRTELGDASLMRYASEIGLDLHVFGACLSGPATQTVIENAALANRLGVSATPSFLFGVRQGDGRVKVNDTMSGSGPISEFERLIKRSIPEENVAVDRRVGALPRVVAPYLARHW